MDTLISEEIRKVQLLRKHQIPWQVDGPWSQKYLTHTDSQWTTLETSPSRPGHHIRELALLSWNIDFMLPYPDLRMSKAIGCLQTRVRNQPDTTASVIFLQESVQSDMDLLAAEPWIQDTFELSDLDDSNWTSGRYGTVTLIDKRLKVGNSFRVHYSQTVMERDAFFTDINLGEGQQRVRLCNTHLESLALEPPRRPAQVRVCAGYMHEEGIHASAMAGDFNSIQDFDRTLHRENGLKDAYLELGGEEDSGEGYTWGQQAATYQRERFGCCRMDKIFYSGALQLLSFHRFGAGIEIDGEEERRQLMSLGFDKPWITDHLGVEARFKLLEAAPENEE